MDFQLTEKGFSAETEFGALHISSEGVHGFRPFQLLIASLASCSGGVLRTILDKKRMEYTDIRIETRAERSQKGRVTGVHFHFVITGKGLEDEAMEKVLKLTRRNCQMVQSVQDSIEITETFTLIEG